MARRLDLDKYVTDWKNATRWEKPLFERGGAPFHPAAEAQEHRGDVQMYWRFLANLEPWVYTDWIDECMSWKETCYIGDWSALVKFRVTGPDALKYISWAAVGSTEKWDVGQAKHCIMCDENGKVGGEGVAMRYAEDDFVISGGIGLWAEYMFNRGDYNATGRQVGPERFLLQVQGPRSPLVLQEVTGDDLTDIGFMRFRNTSIRDMEFTIIRTGMSGEIGYELHGPAEYAGEIYQAVFDAGQEFGIRRLGGRAKQVNHVEACFPTVCFDYVPAVRDIDRSLIADWDATIVEGPEAFFKKMVGGSLEYADISELWRNPVELGWKKVIKFDHDFNGRAAVERHHENQKRDMRTLIWNAEDVMDVFASLFRKGEVFEPFELPRMNYRRSLNPDSVLNDSGELVGVSTSRCYSVFFREMLSLCTLDLDYCEPGTDVTAVWGERDKRWAQKKIRAKVAPAPYKEDKRREDVSKVVAG